jgi:hypothetical protein
MLAMWGTTDRILPEELDPREVWWRDRYKQLSNYGYLLRPRYSPQWVPSWKTSNTDWTDSEDGKRLEVRKFSSYRYFTICHPSLAKLLMQLELRMKKWSL